MSDTIDALAAKLLTMRLLEESSIAGVLTQFNRQGAAPLPVLYPVTATGAILSGPCVFFGAYCVAAGTLTSVHDNASAASGTLLLASQVGAANITYGPGGGLLGVQCVNGIYVTASTGTWHILALPGA